MTIYRLDIHKGRFKEFIYIVADDAEEAKKKAANYYGDRFEIKGIEKLDDI